jgi:hypothetical protein
MPNKLQNLSSIVGFTIQTSQSLSTVDTKGLHNDVTNLLFSITYHPEHISKVTLDLRYIASQDGSLVAKGLDIILLTRIDFEDDVNEAHSHEIREKFIDNFQDLLSLHLLQYDFNIVPLSSSEVKKFLSPFDINYVVEITRRITSYRPFAITAFKGNSPMTRVVDMLLREEGQCFLSISLEPHMLEDNEVRQLEVFGYQNPILPGKQDDELLNSILNLQQIKQSMQSAFKMKIRIASNQPISQYLVNLIGSEISGQRDFYYFRPPDKESLESEIRSLKMLEYNSILRKVINLDLPSILLDLVYLFRAEEALSAFRLPTQRISVAQEKAYKTYPAPVRFLPSRGLRIGSAMHPSYKGELPVYIASEDRARHIYMIGKTGTGKSYQLLNMIQQDVKSEGLCVIDPHGDLVNSVFASIPDERINDVYYFDPADSDYALGFNFLETSPNADESEKDYIIQEVISMLLRFVDYDISMFGPIAQQWTRFGCMTLMDISPCGTLTDVPRLFSDNNYRRSVLARVQDPIIKQWWASEYDTMTESRKNEIMGYFTSKFTPMVTSPQVRNIVGQSTSALNFDQIMNDKKILLVNLSSGRIGKLNSHLLGSIVVSRLLWTALSRAKDPIASRKQFFLYVDEFQNFITDSFEQILSEARKYGLSLTIAHQHLDQLRAMGRMGNKIERAVFGNIGTMISFRLGGDAGTLAGEFGSPADSSSLKNLANRYAVVTMQVEGVPSTPFTLHTDNWTPPSTDMIYRGEQIKEKARKRGRRIEDVIAEINARFQQPTRPVTPVVYGRTNTNTNNDT